MGHILKIQSRRNLKCVAPSHDYLRQHATANSRRVKFVCDPHIGKLSYAVDAAKNLFPIFIWTS